MIKCSIFLIYFWKLHWKSLFCNIHWCSLSVWIRIIIFIGSFHDLYHFLKKYTVLSLNLCIFWWLVNLLFEIVILWKFDLIICIYNWVGVREIWRFGLLVGFMWWWDSTFDIFQSFQMKFMIFCINSVHNCSIKTWNVSIHLSFCEFNNESLICFR